MKDRLMFYFYGSSICNILLVIFLCSCAITKTQLVDPMLICEMESNCISVPSTREARIVGDMGSSIGAFQINLQGALADWNKYNEVSYTRNELFDFEVSKTIALWYLEKRIPQMLRHLGHPVTLETVLTSYNCGISCVGKPLSIQTERYIQKYKRLRSK